MHHAPATVLRHTTVLSLAALAYLGGRGSAVGAEPAPAASVPGVSAPAATGASAPVVAAGTTAGERRELVLQGIPLGLRWCPPGRFTMGSPADEPERGKDEQAHEVTLTRGFWILETEAPQALWTALMPRNMAKFKGPAMPAQTVLWYEAIEFCNALSVAAGLHPTYAIAKDVADPGNQNTAAQDPQKWQVTPIAGADGFRLPTEAQWEYACRAGTTTPFFWGAAITTDQANYNGGNVYNGGPKGKYLETTTPVGTYGANPWGLKDMTGNVYEWCWDWHAPYAGGPETDPQGPASGTARVLRSGCWHYKPAYLRSAARFKKLPNTSWDLLGVRPVVGP